MPNFASETTIDSLTKAYVQIDELSDVEDGF